MTDKQLYRLCKKYGNRVLTARRKFAGLLPEVNRRAMWETRGFVSIYDFAARLAGMTREQVDEVLRLERRFREVPELRDALVNGKVSAGKLARVAVVATAENSVQVLQMARRLTYAALDIKVKEMKNEKDGDGQKVAEESALRGASSALCAQTLEQLGISLEIAEKLTELRRRGMDVNKMLTVMLREREEKLANEEVRLEEKMEREIRDRSRYVPVAVRRLVLQKQGNECAVAGCGRRAVQLHHVCEFARGGSHGPKNLRLLCRGHHELAHLAHGSGMTGGGVAVRRSG